MTKEEKIQVVDELSEKLANTANFYICDTGGLTVAQINKVRGKCFDKGVEYKIIKNTLIKKALDNQEADFAELDESLKGFSGIMFSPESGNVPAKIIKELRKEFDKPVLKGASVEGAIYLGDENLDALSKLKSKNELIGDVIAALQSPAKNVIGALQSGGDKLAGIVKTLQDREE